MKTFHHVDHSRTMLRISPDGTVVKNQPISITFGCTFDLRLFPFDNQQCPIVLEPYAYTTDLLTLNWTTVKESRHPIYYDKQLLFGCIIIQL